MHTTLLCQLTQLTVKQFPVNKMAEFLNLDKIIEMENELTSEFDLSARLSRYESMTPELIDLARDEGLNDIDSITRALFTSDFIITSSEVPTEGTDEERRKSIISSYIFALQNRNQQAEKILSVNYLAYKMGTSLRRNNSFLAGRGIDPTTRAVILVDTYIIPYLQRCQDVLGSGSINYELAMLEAAILQKYPHDVIEKRSKPVAYGSKEMLPAIWEVVVSFISHHKAETNDNIVLPNVGETEVFFVENFEKQPSVSVYNFEMANPKSAVDAIAKFNTFFKGADQTNQLVFLRGRIYSDNKNIVLTRSPHLESNPFILMRTPTEEINVSEMRLLLDVHDLIDRGWNHIPDQIKSIDETYTEQVEVEEERWVEKEVKEEVTVEVKEEPKQGGGGFFGRLKRIFGGSSGPNQPRTRTETQTKKVRDKKVDKVKKNVKKSRSVGIALPSQVGETLAILSLADLRLFETFDTIRESEYKIIGALESDFATNQTSFVVMPDLQNPDLLAENLDGLDAVIEGILSSCFEGDMQIIPTEILYLIHDDRRYIICMDGNDDRLVGTIAQTHKETKLEVVYPPSNEKVETFQRRSLHMRTGQLLSARQHTPFDTAVERIYQIDLQRKGKIITLPHAILPLVKKIE